MRLSDLPLCQLGKVTHICPETGCCKRLRALGVRPGAEVCPLRRAPLGNALEVRVGETLLALRAAEADWILVETA